MTVLGIFQDIGSVEVLLIFVLAIGVSLIPAFIASKKGYSFVGFWLFGVFFFVVALVVALVISPKPGFAPSQMAMRTGTLATCPSCAEPVLAQAIVCKHCQRDLPTRPCPGCSKPFVRTAGSCPWCSRTSTAWRFYAGRWYSVNESGEEFALTADEQSWEPTGRTVSIPR